MTVLPKLSTGLDVNVRFTGVSDFEYTPECIVFDLLNVPLYHGWLLDPQVGRPPPHGGSWGQGRGDGPEGCRGAEQAARRGWGGLVRGNGHGRVAGGFEEPGLVEDVPAHGRSSDLW